MYHDERVCSPGVFRARRKVREGGPAGAGLGGRVSVMVKVILLFNLLKVAYDFAEDTPRIARAHLCLFLQPL